MIWRHYLYRVWCTIYTNHKYLRYLINQHNLNMRQCQWLDVLKDYVCEILYHKGKANIVADALSRKTTSMPMKGVYLRMIVISTILQMIKQLST